MRKLKDPENWKRRCPYCDRKVKGVSHNYVSEDATPFIRTHVKKFHKRKYIKDNWKNEKW